MDFSYIKNRYNVPAELGRQIEFEGKRTGTIIGTDKAYIIVNFDDKKPCNEEYLHPTWEVKYLGKKRIRKITKGQKRYQQYLSSEYNGTFAEYLGIE